MELRQRDTPTTTTTTSLTTTTTTKKTTTISSSSATATQASLSILLGCCLNVLTLEVITRYDKNAGHLITFAQFLYITLQGLTQHFRFPFGLKTRVVPFSIHVKLTLIFFISSLLNNQAFSFGISVPVHTVFRSSGLAASLIVGFIFYGRKYSTYQVISCLTVTFGILILTLADSHQRTLAKECCSSTAAAAILTNSTTSNTVSTSSIDNVDALDPSWIGIIFGVTTSMKWTVGVIMLFLSLILQAVLGHEQDKMYKAYGKHVVGETLFYTHLLSMPCFLFVLSDIFEHAYAWAFTIEPVHLNLHSVIPGLDMDIKFNLYFMLIANILLQSVCVSSVSLLTSCTSALTTTFVITLRKFISLALSVFLFKNTFSTWHWIGSVLVFAGIFLYSESGFSSKKKEEEVKSTTSVLSQTSSSSRGSIQDDFILRSRSYVTKETSNDDPNTTQSNRLSSLKLSHHHSESDNTSKLDVSHPLTQLHSHKRGDGVDIFHLSASAPSNTSNHTGDDDSDGYDEIDPRDLLSSTVSTPSTAVTDIDEDVSSGSVVAPETKRRRGRPPKNATTRNSKAPEESLEPETTRRVSRSSSKKKQ